MPTTITKILFLAKSHGFSAFVLGDMVLIYIEAIDRDGTFFYAIEAVSTLQQTYNALGY